MSEKWQKALEHWKAWNASIKKAKKMVREDFGYNHQLLLISRPELKVMARSIALWYIF